jgi:cytidylate kinase
MSVITISRGTFSGGRWLADCVAGHLGYRCVDRDMIVERAAAHGISQEELRKALDEPPTFLDRLKHKRYLYLALVQAALAEEVREGSVVYHGHCGHLLLKGGGPVLRVRVIAPLEFRISMAQERLKLDRHDAVEYIRKADSDRRKWTQYLYGVDWCDPSLYDFVINLEFIDIERACGVLASTVQHQKCFHFDRACQDAMDDLVRASRVKVELALNTGTSNLELDVVCQGGVVRVKGKAYGTDQVEQIESIARKVEGVASVDLEGLAFPIPA